jgi:hypothetical protein
MAGWWLQAMPGRKAKMVHGRQQRDAGRGHRACGPRDEAADDCWPMLVAALGWWCKLKGVSGHAPGKVSDGGAHPRGMSVARGRSLGGGGERAELGRAAVFIDGGRRGGG